MEFINSKRNKRSKLFYACLFFLSVEIALLIVQYLTKPFSIERLIAGVGRHNYHYLRNTLSFNELIFWSILLIIVFLTYSAYSKIIRRVEIDLEHDRFRIEYIDRFQTRTKTHTVNISSIQTQLDDLDQINSIGTDNGPDFLGENFRRYQSLYLTHKDFGTIMLSTYDFGEENMPLIVEIFMHVRQETAAKIRRRRKK